MNKRWRGNGGRTAAGRVTDETDHFWLAGQPGRSAVLSGTVIFQQFSDTGPTEPLQMERCVSNLVSPPLVLLLLQPYPLFHDNRARRLAEQEESLASVNYDDVVAVCAVRIEERPSTIRVDRVGSVRCGLIGPGSDFTVGASGIANEAARPISAVEGDAHLGDGATHDIVHARPAEGILPFEAGNATAGIVGLDVDDGVGNAGKSRRRGRNVAQKGRQDNRRNPYSQR